MWKTVLFDLDGTLTDSAEGITKCVQHALVQLGHEAPELEDLQCFVGPPLKEMFMEYAGLTEEEGEKAVALYRERYVPTGIYENRLYPRIISMLELFQKEGITMAVASSKPEVYVKQILKHFGIDDYFKVIVGSELSGNRVHKKDVIEEAIRCLKMENHRDQIVLVGDTKYDAEGAKEAGIQCIGVTYGYGIQEDMEGAEFVYLAESVSDIAECVLSQHKKPKKETVGYKLWRIIYPVLMHLGLSEIIVMAALIVLFISQYVQDGVIDTAGAANTVLSYNNILTVALCIISIPIFSWFLRKDEWKRKDHGLRNRLMVPTKFGPKQILLVGVFFTLYSILINQLITWSGLHVLFPTYAEMGEVIFDGNAILLSYLAIALLAPVSEELIYRGLVYRRIRDYLGVRAAMIISALIFGLIHGNVVQFIFAFLMGLVLAAVYERYKTIWAPITAHVAVNLFSCIGEFAQLNILPDLGLGMIVMFVAEGIIVAILGVITLKKWKPKKKAAENTTGEEAAE